MRRLPLLLVLGPLLAAGEEPGHPAGPRFTFHWDDAAEPMAKDLAARAEADRDAIARELGRDFDGPVDVRVAYGPKSFQAMQPPGAHAPVWAQGIAWPRQGVVVIDARLSPSLDAGRRVFKHELSHVAVGRLVPDAPHWFLEGFALVATGEGRLSRAATLARGVTGDVLFTLDELAGPWPDEHLGQIELAYAQSASFVEYLQDALGPERFHAAVAGAGAGRPFAQSIAAAAGRPLPELEARWRRGLSTTYTWIPLLTGTGTLWIGVSLLFIYAWRKVKRRNRARIAAMEAEEASETPAPDSGPERGPEPEDGGPPDEPPPWVQGGNTIH